MSVHTSQEGLSIYVCLLEPEQELGVAFTASKSFGPHFRVWLPCS
jgi:hypothetical protein